MVRRFLGELRWIIQSQVAIHLVGADVMEPHIILARRFKQAECALDVRFHKRFRICNRVVVMRLGRIMHDGIMPRHQFVKQLRIADVAMYELDTIAEDRLDVLEVACIRKCIEHRDMHIRVIVVHVMHEIRADETAATGYNDVLRNECVSHRHQFSNYQLSEHPASLWYRSDSAAYWAHV